MKKKITLVITLTVLTAWLCQNHATGQPPITPAPPAALAQLHLSAARADGSLTNLIEQLVSSGDFCRVRGHRWSGLPELSFTAEIKPPGSEARRCLICETTQRRSYQFTDWQ